MSRYGLCALVVVLLAVAMVPALPILMVGFWKLAGTTVDPTVGAIERVEPDALVSRFQGKSALVVGGTKGIGRGIAIALAKAGAHVRIVGRSGGATVVETMKAVAKGNQSFEALSHDLSTVAGCKRLVKELNGQPSLKLDFLVLTVGVWPDPGNPNTSDGINRVFALDVLARFHVITGLQPILASGARVMSVLASTTYMILPSIDTIKETITGKQIPGKFGFEMLSIAAVSADTVLQQAAARMPNVTFVGTQPGIVATDVIRSTFPPWLADILQTLMKVVALTENQAGEVHANILSSPNLARRQVAYVDPNLQAREALGLAYDPDFGDWLWKTLEGMGASS